ncbi:MarR family transcriptional regulator, partial [Bacillus haynesii]|nr:MarR family transcriptional regulator [Bacillus haynesii]
DERSVIVRLTAGGRALQEKASSIPQHMIAQTDLSAGELKNLKQTLESLLASLTKKT